MKRVKWTEDFRGNWKATYNEFTLRVIRGDTGRWWYSIWVEDEDEELVMGGCFDVDKAKKTAVAALDSILKENMKLGPELDFIHSCSIANDIDKAFDDCRCWFLPVWVWS